VIPEGVDLLEGCRHIIYGAKKFSGKSVPKFCLTELPLGFHLVFPQTSTQNLFIFVVS